MKKILILLLILTTCITGFSQIIFTQPSTLGGTKTSTNVPGQLTFGPNGSFVLPLQDTIHAYAQYRGAMVYRDADGQPYTANGSYWDPVYKLIYAGEGLFFDVDTIKQEHPVLPFTGLVYQPDVVIIDSSVSVLPDIVWQRDGISHVQNTSSTFAIPLEPIGSHRVDLIFIDSNDVIDIVPGASSTLYGVPPTLPNKGIVITYINIDGTSLTQGQNGLVYVDNIYSSLDSVWQYVHYNTGRLDSTRWTGGSGGGATYTAGAGLNLYGTEFRIHDTADGGGSNVIWMPSKNAFRAGSASSTQWDVANIGNYSAAFGTDTKASGSGSFATGNTNNATGDYSVSMGSSNNSLNTAVITMGQSNYADAVNSGAIGLNNFSYGSRGIVIGDGNYNDQPQSYALGMLDSLQSPQSVAIGALNTVRSLLGYSAAVGSYNWVLSGKGTAIGSSLYASSFGGTVVGMSNDRTPATSSTTWNALNRAFQIGIGNPSTPTYANALTVLFNGDVLVGTVTDDASAIFNLVSTTKGFLPPRMTNAQKGAISSPATGLTVYCTDCTATDASTGVMQTYNGTTWKNNW